MSSKLTRREAIKQGGLSLTAFAMPFPLIASTKFNVMTNSKDFDVIIIGGSYAGLSAAMALGRSLRNVLIIDSGLPCNRQTPHSHNFITQDGEKPGIIAEKAKAQVLNYSTVKFHDGLAIDGMKIDTLPTGQAGGFSVTTQKDETFTGKKLVFATGVKDIMPDIKGFSACWGISVIHCPYCHGYEVKSERTGILANGNFALHYAQLVQNLTKDLTIFTNGTAEFTAEQLAKLKQHNIAVVEKEVDCFNHENGNIRQIVFRDHSTFDLKAIYARPVFEQHCSIPEMLGCERTEQGLIKVDMFQKTTIENVFACGDNSSMMRSVANAVSTGNIAGAMVNNGLTEEEF